MRYAYSIDRGETFGDKSCPSRKRAYDWAKIDFPDAKDEDIFTGALIKYYPKINIRAVVKQLQEDAVKPPEPGGRGGCGEYAKGWLGDLSEEELQSLQIHLEKALRFWLKKHQHEPKFYRVENIKPAIRFAHSSAI